MWKLLTEIIKLFFPGSQRPRPPTPAGVWSDAATLKMIILLDFSVKSPRVCLKAQKSLIEANTHRQRNERKGKTEQIRLPARLRLGTCLPAPRLKKI
jgi:hypothetical protein